MNGCRIVSSWSMFHFQFKVRMVPAYITVGHKSVMLNRSVYARIGQNSLIYGPTLNILISMRQHAPTNTRGYLVRINHKSLTNCITYGPATTGAINMLIKITSHQLFKCPLHWLDKLNPFISLFHRLTVAILITKLTKRSAIFVITVVVY